MNEMNEFRKPYEYEEEKGVSGWLMVFYVMLLVFETLLGLITLIQGYLFLNFLKFSPWMSLAYLALGSVNFLLLIFTLVALQKIPKYAIQISKIFLFVRAVFLTIACLVIYTVVSKDFRIVQNFSSKSYFYLSYLGIPLAYILGFSICWFWYFSKSKKVKSYGEMKSSDYREIWNK
jgi:hypothetical protein